MNPQSPCRVGGGFLSLFDHLHDFLLPSRFEFRPAGTGALVEQTMGSARTADR
jgi:hypothetical protein